MENIPPEIVSKILGNLDAPLAPYSTISRNWQHHVEARTMARIHVRSDDASQLDMVFENSRRRALVKILNYEIILPTYNHLRYSKLPGRRECLKNNITFTREIRHLFTKLHVYDKESDTTTFCLELGVSCPMDTYSPTLQQGATAGTGRDRNKNTYIYLDPAEQEQLPVLTKVIGLNQQWGGRNLHSTILGLILRSLPAVEEIEWDFFGPDVRLLDLRRDLRTSLAHILSETSFSSLRVLKLRWADAQCPNHSFRAGSLLNPETGVDELSVALRRVAQLPTIKQLVLHDSFLLSPEFFRYETPSDASLPSAWPSLQILELQLSSMTPAGDWYFTGNPDATEESEERSYMSGSDEEHVDSADSATADDPPVWDWIKLNGEEPYHPWRKEPATSFDHLLLELAKSVPQMPALRRLSFLMGWGMSDMHVGVEFLSSREKSGNIHHIGLFPEDQLYDSPHWEVALRREDEPDNQRVPWEVPEELKQALEYTTGPQGSIHIVNGGQRLVL